MSFFSLLVNLCLHMILLQMVDRLDEGAIGPELGTLDYKGLYKAICCNNV